MITVTATIVNTSNDIQEPGARFINIAYVQYYRNLR